MKFTRLTMALAVLFAALSCLPPACGGGFSAAEASPRLHAYHIHHAGRQRHPYRSARRRARPLPYRRVARLLRQKAPARPGPGRPAHARLARGHRAASAADAAHLFTVAIDAGHGGKDPGTRSPDGIEEKTVTLAIARLVAADIDHQPGMRAVLVRNRDQFLPLPDRARIARQADADILVSIHADACSSRQVHSGHVYVLAAAPGSLRRQDHALAQPVSFAMQHLQGQQVPIRPANFVVLREVARPAVLVETGYLTNRAEAQKLASRRYQQRLAAAISAGIQRYAQHS